MIDRKVLVGLVTAAVLTPMVVLIVLGVSKLLMALGDTAGALCLDRIALCGGVLWGIDLVVLLIVLGINSLDRVE